MLAAALPAALAATALPAAADAATIQTGNKTQDTVIYRAAAGEINDVRITSPGKGVVISDSAPIRLADDDCQLLANGDALCLNGQRVFIELGDGNDRIEHVSPVSGDINAGSGNDLFIAGKRELTRPSQGRIDYIGGDGESDKISYATTNRPVNVSLGDDIDDGRPGENENVGDDVEIVEGSPFGDTITGSDLDKRERFTGGLGNDVINGLGGTDVFHEGPVASGSDDLNGGAGIDLVDYSQRIQGVLIDHDVSFDDGALGENDRVDPNINDVFGSQATDVITTNAGPNVIRGFGGDDTIRAGGGNDTLDGGTGGDTLHGEDGDDTLDTADNTADVIRCGIGVRDVLNRDLQDVDPTGCETINSVGTLALAPKALATEAGKTARLRLSWSHPQSWRKLRTVELRLTQNRVPVGEITIRPRAERITADGELKLVRKHTRLTRKGTTVTARLALRLDDSLAGRTLTADVQATDTRGRRQLERKAGSIRVRN
jgi:hypothetical protein